MSAKREYFLAVRGIIRYESRPPRRPQYSPICGESARSVGNAGRRPVNAILGVQIRPVEKVFINIEGGLRTIPFIGGTAGYYF